MLLPKFAERLHTFRFFDKTPDHLDDGDTADMEKPTFLERVQKWGHGVSRFLGHLFDHHGRATRKEFLIFWAAQVLLTLLIYAPLVYWFCYYPNAFINPYTGDVDTQAAAAHMQTLGFAVTMFSYLWVLTVSHLALIFAWCTTVARRLRDMGWTPWWMVTGFVPGIAILLWIVLVVYPSKPEEQTSADASVSQSSPVA